MVDTEAPRVDNFTLSDTALKIGDNATVTLVFSEVVIEFTAADITNPNGSLPSMTSSDNITWTGTFTPTANTEDANNTLSLATSYTDLAGNAGLRKQLQTMQSIRWSRPFPALLPVGVLILMPRRTTPPAPSPL